MNATLPLLKIHFTCMQMFRGKRCNRTLPVVIPLETDKKGIEIWCPRCEQTTILD